MRWPWQRHDRDLFQIGSIVPGLHLRRGAGQPDHGHATFGSLGLRQPDRRQHLDLPLAAYRHGERDPLRDLPPVLRALRAGTNLPDFLDAALQALLVRGNCFG